MDSKINMDSKLTEIDVHSPKYSSPVGRIIVYDVKKANEDRETAHYVADFELDNNWRYYNNKSLAESMTTATTFEAQQPTLRYYSEQVKRTEKIHKILEGLTEKIEAQKMTKKELLKSVVKN